MAPPGSLPSSIAFPKFSESRPAHHHDPPSPRLCRSAVRKLTAASSHTCAIRRSRWRVGRKPKSVVCLPFLRRELALAGMADSRRDRVATSKRRQARGARPRPRHQIGVFGCQETCPAVNPFYSRSPEALVSHCADQDAIDCSVRSSEMVSRPEPELHSRRASASSKRRPQEQRPTHDSPCRVQDRHP